MPKKGANMEQETLLVSPEDAIEIREYNGRAKPRKVYAVRFAVKENESGLMWNARYFDFKADAAKFMRLVNHAGGAIRGLPTVETIGG